MEDINNALLHIKAKYNGEIPYQYGSRECAKLMDSYAKEYHERELKLLGIANVVGRSEQLVCGECGYPMFYHKPDDIMYCHGCNNTKPAN